MQLTPCYGTSPVIVLDGAPEAIAEPAICQRRRLVERLSTFTDDEWSHPSRCEGWSARDVIVHLDSTNGFWAYTIGAGAGGERTELLSTFDPVVMPARLVSAGQDLTPSDVFEQFAASSEALIEIIQGLSAGDFSKLAEAPPGHISISAVAHHALWDAWVHERDILLPQGETPVEAPDEVLASLRYVSALGPAVGINLGGERRGVVTIDATDPDAAFAVEIGDRVTVRTDADQADLTLRGDTVHLLEAFSRRVPLDQEIPDDSAWMLGGLAEIFDEV